jgi:hypothetical protein
MKEYTIEVTRTRYGREPRTTTYTGTVAELTKIFGYTLEKGKCYENERGNKKINTAPKTIKSLVSNLEKASSNAAQNGYSGIVYTLV